MAPHEQHKKPAREGGLRPEGVRDILVLLQDPSKRTKFSSGVVRGIETFSLLLNISSFYLIVMLNKMLLKAPAKGGYVRAHLPFFCTVSCDVCNLLHVVPDVQTQKFALQALS